MLYTRTLYNVPVYDSRMYTLTNIWYQEDQKEYDWPDVKHQCDHAGGDDLADWVILLSRHFKEEWNRSIIAQSNQYHRSVELSYEQDNTRKLHLFKNKIPMHNDM